MRPCKGIDKNYNTAYLADDVDDGDFCIDGYFRASGPILLFDPDASYGTITISFWIFKQVYGSGAIGGTGSYGLVSAAGLCFTLVGVPLIMFTRWLLNKIPVVEY